MQMSQTSLRSLVFFLFLFLKGLLAGYWEVHSTKGRTIGTWAVLGSQGPALGTPPGGGAFRRPGTTRLQPHPAQGASWTPQPGSGFGGNPRGAVIGQLGSHGHPALTLWPAGWGRCPVLELHSRAYQSGEKSGTCAKRSQKGKVKSPP